MLHGADRSKTKIGNKFLSKIILLLQMLVVLHAGGFNPELTTGDNLQKRYDRYYKRYKATLLVKNQSRGGPTTVEACVGLTFDDKLGKMCPHFQ